MVIMFIQKNKGRGGEGEGKKEEGAKREEREGRLREGVPGVVRLQLSMASQTDCRTKAIAQWGFHTDSLAVFVLSKHLCKINFSSSFRIGQQLFCKSEGPPLSC